MVSTILAVVSNTLKVQCIYQKKHVKEEVQEPLLQKTVVPMDQINMDRTVFAEINRNTRNSILADINPNYLTDKNMYKRILSQTRENDENIFIDLPDL